MAAPTNSPIQNSCSMVVKQLKAKEREMDPANSHQAVLHKLTLQSSYEQLIHISKWLASELGASKHDKVMRTSDDPSILDSRWEKTLKVITEKQGQEKVEAEVLDLKSQSVPWG
ncbi:LOW QUALITY PROTEIN: hypothetical protein TorRG33x02_167490 [Trema orientale]|uniref:Uncharacterized protein n=1 Tax=Trema orientale TaxID=63057 RepID=A0A2P5EPD1_TREOI|nr:LOW QUALITY PROTEIN: hypothetical protein TorRG33x02_167490 [Trema orientale]